MPDLDARFTGARPDPVAIGRVVAGRGPGGVQRHITARARRGLREAQRRVGVDTGLLQSTLRMETGVDAPGFYADIVAGIAGRTDYLGYHLYGTEPHVIRPRRARALRFVGRDGRIVFATRVQHPGTTGNDFLAAALTAASA